MIYKLHAKEERRNGFSFSGGFTLPSSVVLLDHEHSLLILIPQTDGAWVLKRVRDWDTKTSSEDTLEITGERVQGQAVAIDTDLTLSRDGKYLLVRINYRRGAIEPKDRNRSAVITIVDMRSFSLVSRQTTSDLLLADSHWAFDDHNNFISKGLDKWFTDQGPNSRSFTSHFVAALLDMPSLAAHERCEFDSVSQLQTGETGWTKPVTANESDGCAVLVHRTSLNSIDALPGPDPKERLNAVPGCAVLDSDSELNLELRECREGWSYADALIEITKSHTAKVVSTATKQTVLSIPLSHGWSGVTGVLASVASGNYVILVKKGIHIEVYRISE